jgi:glycosyltransferase involved in cell wall biosynthesis
LGDRHHPDLNAAAVNSFTTDLIFFETQQRLLKTQAWSRMIARNNWYQQRVIQVLKKLKKTTFSSPNHNPMLFTYSYAALEILKYAKAQGWTTVLGQIDPGEEEEKIVLAEFKKYPELAPDWEPVPPEYWKNWRAECELSDHILVNSDWSKDLLIQGGIQSTKIKTVPLVYQPPSAAINFQRTYPEKFTKERPLRVLFLGLITLRKGIAACLEAIATLEGQPLEFWFVGSQQIKIPEPFKHHPQIKWIGTVPRSETASYYQQADVFLFPTLSDGFGLTQLEAQAWKLPIIASQYCAKIVEHNLNGILLNTADNCTIGDKLNNVLKNLLSDPQKLKDLSLNSQIQQKNTIESLALGLTDL